MRTKVTKLQGREPLLRDPLAIWRGVGRKSQVRLDLSDVEFVCPLDLVGIAAWSVSLETSQRRDVILPPDDIASYLQRMELLSVLRSHGWSIPPVATEPPEDVPHKLLEVTSLDDVWAVEDLADRLPRLFSGSSKDPRKLMALHFAFGELCDNAASHSGSFPFFVAAQRYTGETTGPPPRLELAVADAGIGIPKHLRRNPEYSEVDSDSEAIALALNPGVTGTTDRRGYGFYDVLRETGEVAEGMMHVFSGRGAAVAPFGTDGRRRRYSDLDASLRGTWIEIRLHE